ncbi:EXS family-domain-containing protein [Xylaria bambusicola]|uniref:EXS family-domain-containing protein n=1 Tax=Xylaria bambusicola TaxID=326684 RepID=UPI0020081C4E|nr:EXS family-domain-containing protein [Xylaria bambusicola]KAI0525490.1 EXS family-domain-containing protein [Xylaria bambusicola]
MKFAKELEQDLVPEWRIKYLNYKAGKKYIKSVARAVNRANGTPRANSRRLPPREVPPFFRSPFSLQQVSRDANSQWPEDIGPPTSGLHLSRQATRSEPANMPVPNERQSLSGSGMNETNYGSFVRTPPASSALSKADSRQTFELPGPAIHLPSPAVDASGIIPSTNFTRQHTTPVEQASTRTVQPVASGRLRRIFSQGSQLPRAEDTKGAYPLEAIDTVRQREKEFFDFLDGELNKVETFYRQKELQAEARLAVLREQLHEMRNRRTQEVAELRRLKTHKSKGVDGSAGNSSGFNQHLKWTDPIKSRIFKPGANSKALARMPQTPVVGAMAGDATRDYIRRPYEHDVSYRTAKRKLKLALQELYRGMELLKSYALLNRTAFRKLNKKYDKAVNARPPYRYMNEKVNKSWFVSSEVIDGHIKAIEDLYARYFEKGNHKIAASKLRRMNRRPSDKSNIAFWNGLSIGIGAVFTIQGLTYGAQLLYDPDPTIRLQTSYLLQLYGGYFLILLLFSLFCLDCYFWTANKINYPFIFEFDTRHNLDWRQLAIFPGFFLLVFGIFIWLNFTRYGDDKLWLYYPVILIFVTLLIIFLPARVLWYRSRQWLAYSHFRLFFAGLYPVEFRDFFLGDMYCSLTYAMSNVELFFCLYANYWENPPMCNSSHSRLLGFFTTLPGIWRALQCLRRYYDTKNMFPHLVNCGKYIMTILSYVMLSLYRIQNTHSHLALYIAFAVINGLYTSIWDLFMDFSLLQPDARHPLLRDILGLKRRWIYYAIMIIDPILRFNWIFYAIFTHDTQHSTIASFLIGFTEVIRRGLWTLLRVENEHCTNVAQYKASRDVPLPYNLHHEPLMERASTDEQSGRSNHDLSNDDGGLAPSQDQRRPDGQQSAYSPAPVDEAGLRRRGKQDGPASKSIRGIMASAHRQDFEKKRRPAMETDLDMRDLSADDLRSEDEDDDDSGSVAEEGQGDYDTESLVQVQRDEISRT